MHPILTRQNDPELIRLLEASTVAYSRAKGWEGFITYFLVVLAFAYPVVLIFMKDEDLKLFLFVCSFVISVAVQIYMDTFKGNTSRGALFKEAFDIALFQIPWKSTLPKPEISEVHQLSRDYKATPIRNWYPTQLSESIPNASAIAVLQHSNTSWDIELRRKYKLFLILFMSFYSVLLLIAIIEGRMNLLNIFLLLFSLLSFITHIIMLIRTHTAVIRKREKISNMLDDIIMHKKDISLHELRDIQDEIFLTRQESAKVPNFFFRLHAKKLNTAAEEYIHSVNDVYKK